MSSDDGLQTIGVGIDLGTANSVVSRVHFDHMRPEFRFAKDLSGAVEIPSSIYVDQFQTSYYGVAAANAQVHDKAKGLVFNNVKLLLRDDEPLKVGEQEYLPSELVRGFLVFLRKCYAKLTGEEDALRRAVITVPAGATFDADYISGLKRAIGVGTDEQLFDDPQFLDEPDAALLSLGDLRPLDGQTILVFDMGGGTLDVCVRRVTAEDGQPHLAALGQDSAEMAGRVVTDALSDLLISRWANSSGRTFSDEQRAVIRSRNFLRTDQTKRFISSFAIEDDNPVSVRGWSDHLSFEGKTFDYEVCPKDLDSILLPVVDAARKTVLGALADANISATDVDSYFMVGGSSRLTQIATMLQDLFGRRPRPQIGRYGTMDPGLAVAQGAAMFDLQGYITAQSNAGLSTAGLPVIPTIERRLAYTVSVLGESNGAETARAIIPKGVTLPSPRFELSAFLPKDSWTLDVELKKGEGNPKLCKDFHVRQISFETMRKRGDRVVIGLSIDGNGDIELDHV